MDKEKVSFYYFRDYAQFLLQNHLDELTTQDLTRSEELNLPLLKLFQNLSKEQLFEVSKKGIKEYLESIIEGFAIDKIIKGNQDWKEDKLPGIPRDKVVASDIALIYNIRKHSLRHFLSRYTSNLELIINILDEIDDYYTYQEEIAISTFAEINKEEIKKRETRLREAQQLANLGYWEYDFEENKVFWSDELYKVYGLQNDSELPPDTISKLIYPEDLEPLMGKVKDIYENGGSFTHEYRIKTVNGDTKHLLDKGYTEKTLGGKVLVKGVSQDITDRRRTEEKLAENTFFIKNVTEAAPFLITVFDYTSNRTVYVNKNAYHLIGLTAEEIKQKGLDIIDLVFHPSDASKVGALLEKVKSLKDGEVEELEYRVKDNKGDWKWLMSRVSPFKRNEKGEVTQLLSFASDINERKKASEDIQKNERLLREAQEISHLGSWEWDTVKNVVNWSDEMYRLFGYEPKEINMDYEKYFAHIHPEDKEKVAEAINQCFTNGTPYSFENKIIRKDGKIRWLHAKGQVSEKEDDRHLKLAGIAMDITEQKKAEEAIQQRTQALIASNKELEAFCYTISHDLRSPLRAIDGFGRKLDNQYKEKLDKEGQRLLGIVRSNAQQMGVLIDSLLEFSRLNRKDMNRTPIDMGDLIQQVIEESKHQNQEHNAHFKIHNIVNAPGDRELLKMVWTNLISNAIKFSSKVAKPIIEIGSEKRGKQIVYFVKDNGAGFEMEYADKLFGVFQRLHSQEEFSGTGVGLASVQRIIHRHGGRVWAEGKPNEGATFYFSLNVIQEAKEQLILN